MFDKAGVVVLVQKAIANQANNAVKELTPCCGRYDLNVPANVIETDLVKVIYTDECIEVLRKSNNNPVVYMHNKEMYRIHGELTHVLDELNRLAGIN